MSPSASAPKIASVSACMPTSASEWPTSPRSKGMATPQSVTSVAGPEGVHVEAVAGADVHRHLRHRPGAREIGGRRDLEVRLVARHQPHLEPGGPRHRHVVGGLAAVGAVGGEDRREVEALRRLRPPEPLARHRCQRAAVGGAPERVDDRQGREGRRRRVERRDHVGDQPPAGEGTRGVVDQHPVRRLGRERLEAGADRFRPGSAACDRRAQPGVVEAGDRAAVEVAVVRVDDDLNEVDRRDGRTARRWRGRAPSRRRARGTASASILPNRRPRPAATIKPAVRIYPSRARICRSYKADPRTATMPRRRGIHAAALVSFAALR